MTPPHIKRFQKRYGKLADAISSLDIAQTDRELVAGEVTEALVGQPDFLPDLFHGIAQDPLVACAGPGPGEPCPHGRRIRIPMHLNGLRAKSWRPTLPREVRCVSCGSAYHRNHGALPKLGPVERLCFKDEGTEQGMVVGPLYAEREGAEYGQPVYADGRWVTLAHAEKLAADHGVELVQV